jgi:flagellin
MSGIVLSRAVRSNLTALQSTSDLISNTQTRLATGKRVNSALDNPSNFFTSSSLNSRAGDLSNLLDSVSNAIKTLEAADNGIKSLTKLVESAQAIARQAQQATATTASVTGTVSGFTSASTVVAANGNTLQIGDGTTTTTITAAGGVLGVEQIIDAVNSTANQTIKASLSSDGRLKLEARGATTIVIGGTATAPEKALLGLVDGTTAAGTLNTSRSSLATQFDTIRTQVNQLAADSSFNGVNLLNGGSLSVIFNEKSTSSLTISGVTFSSGTRTVGADNDFNSSDDTVTGLGINAAAGTFQTDKDINDALGSLTAALSTLRAQASAFGSNLSVVQTRQDFTKATINTLRAGADNLVLADTNEEGANLLALQTRQQLSSTALSLASQADQQVLRLF